MKKICLLLYLILFSFSLYPKHHLSNKDKLFYDIKKRCEILNFRTKKNKECLFEKIYHTIGHLLHFKSKISSFQKTRFDFYNKYKILSHLEPYTNNLHKNSLPVLKDIYDSIEQEKKIEYDSNELYNNFCTIDIDSLINASQDYIKNKGKTKVLENKNADVHLDWIKMAYTNYYNRPYRDDPTDTLEGTYKNIDGVVKKVIVTRPIHGIVHAVRKSALIKDIIEIMPQYEHNEMSEWIKSELKTNKQFTKQMEFAALMMRSGRESEDTQNNHYDEYCNRSASFFEKEAKNLKPSIFTTKDIDDIKIAMIAMGTTNDNMTLRQINLYNILYAAHHLDLRRILNLTDDNDKKGVMSFLDITETSETFKKIWNKSGDYLLATGDTDRISGKRIRRKSFFELSSNPDRLFNLINSIQKEEISGENALRDLYPINKNIEKQNTDEKVYNSYEELCQFKGMENISQNSPDDSLVDSRLENSTISDDEIKTIANYTKFLYKDVNPFLNKGLTKNSNISEKKIIDKIKTLDSGLSKLQTFKKPVYRSHILTDEENKEIQNGKLTIKHYGSTSRAQFIADKFYSQTKSNNKFILVINGGHEGKLLGKYSHNTNEFEVLLPRGSTFNVSKKGYVKKNGQLFHVMCLNQAN